jgi:anaerobic magnesium-protoporphyrin IX monomethyl ester cyclase
MDVQFVYCDSGAPSRYLRYLDTGVYHQVLADSQMDVSSVLVHPDPDTQEILARIAKERPKLLVLNVDEFNAARSFEFAAAVRGALPDLAIAAIGIYTILAPDRVVATKHFNFLIIGEGEIALYELASQLLRGDSGSGLKNVWRVLGARVERNPLRPLQDNVDMLPYPNRSLFAQEPCPGVDCNRVLYVSASRGCPHECLFCYSPVLKKAYEGKGGYYRMRSVPHLTGEILSELRRHEYRSIVFLDEMFPLEKNWLKQVGQRIGGEHAVPFHATVASDKIDDDTLDLLQRAGCRSLQIGLETGNDAFRRRLVTRNMDAERVQRVVLAARHRGIATVVTTMTGLPLESEAVAQESYTLCHSLASEATECFAYNPIPATKLHLYAQDKFGLRAGELEPDFARAALELPEYPPAAVEKHLERVRLLKLAQKSAALPKPEGYHSILGNIAAAKLDLRDSRSVDLGAAHLNGSTVPYLELESGSACAFPVELRERSFLKFSTFVPQASVLRMKNANASLVAEVLWKRNGTERSIFHRRLGADEFAYRTQWQEYYVPIPEEAGQGEMVFRVSAEPEGAVRANVFWAAPVLVDVLSLVGGAPPPGLKEEYEAKLSERDKEIGSLRRDLEEARRDELGARQQRDDRARRIGELHTRVIELETELKKVKLAYAEMEAALAVRDAGIGGKLKGMFRKG